MKIAIIISIIINVFLAWDYRNLLRTTKTIFKFNEKLDLQLKNSKEEISKLSKEIAYLWQLKDAIAAHRLDEAEKIELLIKELH
ncbi:MAG: hypothetical protein V4683_07915 [Bacteroidota bacterium]